MEPAMSHSKATTMEKDDTSFWDAMRGKIHTRKGGLVISTGTVKNHGYDLLNDLMGNIPYFQLLILNVTGRIPERRLAEWLEAYFFCLSYPDARIWCNHIGSLAGTLSASPVAATCAGVLTSDSRMYGPGAVLDSVNFITDALSKKKTGMSAEEIVKVHPRRRPDGTPMISGYNRPVASGDERIPALERITARLGFQRGEHLTLAFEIEEVMYQKYNEHINSGGYRSAFLCDQGFSGKEIYRILSLIVSAGVMACYCEAADRPGETFFPLRCDDIDYQGKPPRALPDNH
jgi:hypothetical protein